MLADDLNLSPMTGDARSSRKGLEIPSRENLQRASRHITRHRNHVRVKYKRASTTYPCPCHRSATRRCAGIHRDIEGSQYVALEFRVQSNRR